MTKLIAFFTLSGLLVCSSCSEPKAITTSYSTTKQTSDYRALPVTQNNIYQKPQVADLAVSSKRIKLIINYENMSPAAAKELIKGEFMKQQKCDVIVEPYLYTTTVYTNGTSSVKATISGYPATYKEIRNYELKDSIFFKQYSFVQ